MKPLVLMMCGIFLGDIWNRFRSGSLKEMFGRMNKVEYILMCMCLGCTISSLTMFSALMILENVLNPTLLSILLFLPLVFTVFGLIIGVKHCYGK